MAKNIIHQLEDLAETMERGQGRSTIYGAADELRRLNSLVAELLPYMLNDMTQGLAIGQPPFDKDHCSDEQLPCSDCQWFEDATLWRKRVDAGEFKGYV